MHLYCSSAPTGPLRRVGYITPAGDRSTFAYNPFTRKWVFHVTGSLPHGRRHVTYFASDRFEGHIESICVRDPCCRLLKLFSFCNHDFITAYARRYGCLAWHDRNMGRPANQSQRFFNWLSTDALDGHTPYQGRPADVYAADTSPYESLTLVGHHIYFSGHLFDKDISLSLGFARDGFSTIRPTPRFDFAHVPAGHTPYYYPSFVGGLLCVHADHITFHISGLRHKTREALEAGTATAEASDFVPLIARFRLRRDGFASIAAAEGVAVGQFSTPPVRITRADRLFLNARVPSDGRSTLTVSILNATSRNVLGASGKLRFDQTAHRVDLWWGDVNCQHECGSVKFPASGVPVRLRFTMRGDAELFAFWLTPKATGESGGRLPPCVPPATTRGNQTISWSTMRVRMNTLRLPRVLSSVNSDDGSGLAA